MADQQCPDCHVQPGHPHHLGCDMARCPACGIQRIQCDAHADDRTLDARAVWTGAAPTVADDYRQRIAEALAATCKLHQIEGECAACGRRLAAVMAVRDEDLQAWRERGERLEAANAQTRERLDALIAAGFGAVGRTLRELRALLDDQEADRG